MREIKFRAWDKVSKMFVYFTVKVGEEVFLDPTRFAEELYLYTGLKDKNGKEIYAGDIVAPTPNAQVNYEVKWNEYRAGFMLIGRKPHYVLELYVEPFEREVIGNIYENPELLKDTP